jgi:adenosylhomocysteine nucleosidase
MTIGILAALDRELEAFKEREAELATRGCILKTCGVGKVNAALAAFDLIHRHGAEQIIVVGTCASLHTHLRQGRIVLATETAYHDVDVSALGFLPGTIPYHGTCLWKPHPDLTHLLATALADAGDSSWTGRMLTGDRFIASRKEARRLAEEFHGSALDMETAAVAHACAAAGIGWAAIRVVSDNADEKAPVDFETLVRTASRRLVAVILRLRTSGSSTLKEGAGI